MSSFKLCNVVLQNPNALDSKVLVDFDHVKKSLKVDDEGELYGFSMFLGVDMGLSQTLIRNLYCVVREEWLGGN